MRGTKCRYGNSVAKVIDEVPQAQPVDKHRSGQDIGKSEVLRGPQTIVWEKRFRGV